MDWEGLRVGLFHRRVCTLFHVVLRMCYSNLHPPFVTDCHRWWQRRRFASTLTLSNDLNLIYFPKVQIFPNGEIYLEQKFSRFRNSRSQHPTENLT